MLEELNERRWTILFSGDGEACWVVLDQRVGWSWNNMLDGAELTCLPIQLQAKIAILILLAGNDIKILTAKINFKLLI